MKKWPKNDMGNCPAVRNGDGMSLLAFLDRDLSDRDGADIESDRRMSKQTTFPLSLTLIYSFGSAGTA